MKVLGIVCSPRRGGNTEILVNEALSSARELGAETEIITLAGKDIHPCEACESCRKTLKCKINDDVKGIFDKLLAADGVIFGTPVYFWNVSAQAKIIIDRTFLFIPNRNLRKKLAGVIVVARRAGASEAFSAFFNFFNRQRLVPVGGAIAHTGEPLEDEGSLSSPYSDQKGDVRRDKRGIAEARALGKAIVKAFKAGQAGGPGTG